MNEIEKEIKDYVLEEFLPGEDPANLTISTPLLSTRVLDSLAILKLVAFLEDQFNVTIEAYETSEDYMDSIADIARLVQSKKS
jgi:acyl carrier protein